MVFTVAMLNDLFGVAFQSQRHARSLFNLVDVAALLVLLAFAFSLFTERHTESLRKRILASLPKQTCAAARKRLLDAKICGDA